MIQKFALLGIYPNRLKTCIYTKTWTLIFIAALSITAKTWEQPTCPSIDEWINKLWYKQIMEYYSALKRNKLLSQEKLRRNLKCLELSERNQSEKVTHCTIPTKWYSGWDLQGELDLGVEWVYRWRGNSTFRVLWWERDCHVRGTGALRGRIVWGNDNS